MNADEADCEHGWPADALTREGLPRCPLCRHRLLRRRARLQQSMHDLVRIPPPPVDRAVLAAGDDD